MIDFIVREMCVLIIELELDIFHGCFCFRGVSFWSLSVGCCYLGFVQCSAVLYVIGVVSCGCSWRMEIVVMVLV